MSEHSLKGHRFQIKERPYFGATVRFYRKDVRFYRKDVLHWGVLNARRSPEYMVAVLRDGEDVAFEISEQDESLRADINAIRRSFKVPPNDDWTLSWCGDVSTSLLVGHKFNIRNGTRIERCDQVYCAWGSVKQWGTLRAFGQAPYLIGDVDGSILCMRLNKQPERYRKKFAQQRLRLVDKIKAPTSSNWELKWEDQMSADDDVDDEDDDDSPKRKPMKKRVLKAADKTRGVVTGALKSATKRKLAAKLNAQVVASLKKAAPAGLRKQLETPFGRQILPFLAPLIGCLAVNMITEEENIISEQIEMLCGLAIENALEGGIDELQAFLSPFLSDLTALASGEALALLRDGK